MDSDFTFDVLLNDISTSLNSSTIIQVKPRLIGHIDKESIDRIHNGKEFVEMLRRKHLIGPNKLVLLRKLVQNIQGCEEKISEVIKNFTKKQKSNKEPIADETDEKDAPYRIMENRLLMTIQDLEDSITTADYDCLDIESRKETILLDIEALKQNIFENTEEKEEEAIKFEITISKVKEKEEECSKAEEILETLKNQKRKYEKTQERSREKLAAQGSQRLTTFEKTFEKDVILKLENKITGIEKEIMEQAKKIAGLQDDLQIIYLKKDLRRNKARAKMKEVLKGYERQHTLYESLRTLNKRLLSANDERSALKLSLAITMDELLITREEQQKNKNKLQVIDVAGEIKKILAEQRQDFDYEFMGSKIFSIGEKGNDIKPVQFNNPVAITIDQNGNLIVADSGNKRLVYMRAWGECFHVLDLDVMVPKDIAVDTANRCIVVSDSLIRVYSEDFLLHHQFLPYYVPQKMRLPKLISVTYNHFTEEIFILDKSNHHVQIFTKEGDFKYLKELESINSPKRIEILSETRFIITEGDYFTMYNFHAPTLYTRESIGGYGVAKGKFLIPSGICTDHRGNVTICDTNNHRFQIFSSENHEEVIVIRGRLGSQKNCFYYPIDVCFHPGQMFYFLDRGNHRILVYA